MVTMSILILLAGKKIYNRVNVKVRTGSLVTKLLRLLHTQILVGAFTLQEKKHGTHSTQFGLE